MTEQEPAGENRSTHFDLQHAVFQMEDVRFLVAADDQPSMLMKLGDVDVAMTIKALRAEFKLDLTADGDLLDQLVEGLRFVKVIRPGDSIPREILDGSASWSIEERHHDIAKGRITLQISTWLGGEEQVISDENSLLQLAEDPAIKQRVQAAFAEIAVRLGLPRDRKQEVIDRIETLARELAYVEALRERFGVIGKLRAKLMEFRTIYRRDRSIDEELQRIENLMRRPFAEIEAIFDQVDAQSGEIIAMLRNINNQIEFIRKSRDDLHVRMMLWDDVVVEWAGLKPERSLDNEAVLRSLYRFLARNFNIEKTWQLTSSAFDRKPG
jgi:hypothetical protein